MTKTHDLSVSFLRTGASRLCLSYVVCKYVGTKLKQCSKTDVTGKHSKNLAY
jgi:hypothetical protein